MSTGDVVEAMADRLSRTAARRGVSLAGCESIVAAHRLAATHRRAQGASESDLLHPARSVLILLDDVRVTDPDALAAAALTESEHERFTLPLDLEPSTFSRRVGELAAAVPTPAKCGEELLETLLAASASVLQIALAERLDHARHLHLQPRALWADRHGLVGTVYLPVAARSDSVLEARLRWWYDMFEQRFLKT